MPTVHGSDQGPAWPGYPVLVLCALLVSAGYAAAYLRGNLPDAAVVVVLVPPPATEPPITR